MSDNVIIFGIEDSNSDVIPILNIDLSENIGIHTLNPLVTLDISNSGSLILPRGSASIRIDNADFSGNVDSCIRYDISAQLLEGRTDGGWIYLYNQCSADMGTRISVDNNNLTFFTDDTQRMQINSSGNIGILKDPVSAYKIDVSGTVFCGSVIDYSGTFQITPEYIYENLDITELDVSNIDVCGNATIDGNTIVYNYYNNDRALNLGGDISCTRLEPTDISYIDAITIPTSSTNLGNSQVGDIRKSSSGGLEMYNGTEWLVSGTFSDEQPYMVFNHAKSEGGWFYSDSPIYLYRLDEYDEYGDQDYEITTNRSDIFNYTTEGGEGITIDTSGVFLATITAALSIGGASESIQFRYMIFKDTTKNSSDDLEPIARDGDETNSSFITRVVSVTDASVNFLYVDELTDHDWPWNESNNVLVETMGGMNTDHIETAARMAMHNSFTFTLAEPSSLIIFGSSYGMYVENFQLRVTKLGELGTLAKYEYGDEFYMNFTVTGTYETQEYGTDVSYVAYKFTGDGTFSIVSDGFDVDVSYLVVAGGGSGGHHQTAGGGGTTGGGGAGGYLEGSETLTANSYTIVVGGGGAAITQPLTAGDNGDNSSLSGGSITTILCYGGGGGGYPISNTGSSGLSGGSGGGGAGYATASGGSGTSGQGNAGGSANGAWKSGGGGGAGSVGLTNDGDQVTEVDGGDGKENNFWDGTDYWYAAGGGSGGIYSPWQYSPGYGGSNIGGLGGRARYGEAGATNTGSGGGGGGYMSTEGAADSGAGGSGIVILKMIKALPYILDITANTTVYNIGSSYTDGAHTDYFETNIWSSGGNNYLSVKIYDSVSFIISSSSAQTNVDVLIVGGGGREVVVEMTLATVAKVSVVAGVQEE